MIISNAILFTMAAVRLLIYLHIRIFSSFFEKIYKDCLPEALI